jgi:hypothetical protein
VPTNLDRSKEGFTKMNKSLLLASMMVVALAACGKKETPAPAPAPAPAAAPAPAPAPAAAPAPAPAADAAKPAEGSTPADASKEAADAAAKASKVQEWPARPTPKDAGRRLKLIGEGWLCRPFTSARRTQRVAALRPSAS